MYFMPPTLLGNKVVLTSLLPRPAEDRFYGACAISDISQVYFHSAATNELKKGLSAARMLRHWICVLYTRYDG